MMRKEEDNLMEKIKYVSFNDLSKEEKLEMLEALEKTKVLSCPPEELRVLGHTECFHCNECRRYALMKSLNMLD